MRQWTTEDSVTAADFQIRYEQLFQPSPLVWTQAMVDWLEEFDQFQIEMKDMPGECSR